MNPEVRLLPGLAVPEGPRRLDGGSKQKFELASMGIGCQDRLLVTELNFLNSRRIVARALRITKT